MLIIKKNSTDLSFKSVVFILMLNVHELVLSYNHTVQP